MRIYIAIYEDPLIRGQNKVKIIGLVVSHSVFTPFIHKRK